MVLGLRSKNKRSISTQVDYTIHIQEIKPWPPSQSLKYLKSVVLQWENGYQTSGLTSPVSPSQWKIEFNEKFNLHVTLVKETSGKGNGYQKNVLELSLYEPRRDKALKGQLLGNASVDLAEYGVVKDVVSIGVPLNCKRSYRNTAQPMVYVKIQLFDKEKRSSASSSFRDDSLSKESVLALMSGEYAEEEETEIASFTDDDVSSHSSLGNLASAIEGNAELGAQGSQEQPMHRENEPDAENENKVSTNSSLDAVPVKQEFEPIAIVPDTDGTGIHLDKNLPQSLPEESSVDSKSLDNGDTSFSTSTLEKLNAPTAHSSSSSPASEGVQEKMVSFGSEKNVVDEPQKTAGIDTQNEMPKPLVTIEPELIANDKISLDSRDDSDGLEEEKMDVVRNHSVEIEPSDSSPDNGSVVSCESTEKTPVGHHKHLQNALRKPVNSDSTNSSHKILGEMGSRSLSTDRLKNMQFTRRSPPHSLGSSERCKNTSKDQYVEDVKEIDMSQSITSNLGKVKHSSVSKNRVQELEAKVEMLEGELREAAATEISLYSIVAEHGSSQHKVHTPARRLSRLYIHASKQWSQERKANAAKSVVSGLVLVAKACRNDVPRLTFWLSNSIVLRTIITRALGHSDISNNVNFHSASKGSRLMAKGKSSPLKWESHRHKKETLSFTKVFDDWENLSTFTAVLERIESWIFSQIVESIWWQTLTPHMQSTNELAEAKTGWFKKKNIGRKPRLGNKNNENFSIEIWRKAFRDACERLCPVRAEGHKCGCLPMLPKLVMEQCIARLDVAMFNAVLRESDDEMPTDPISDPISDPKVLPVPPGKLSFGAGAQLKNAIGNWSRWLTDLFGMDMDESPQGKNEQDDERVDVVETFKSFCLLNALSDLLMLPKDMLLEKSIRKEVCPTFSASMIKRILGIFSSDEFCPDAIPDEVLEALDSEDLLEGNREEIQVYPCNASSVSYSTPSAASIENIIGDIPSTSVVRRTKSSVIRKCHTSDDELDELDSPLASIMLENSSTAFSQLKNNSSVNFARYHLLCDVWRSDD